MPAKTLIWVPIDDAFREAIRSSSTVPEKLGVSISGNKVEPFSREYPLDPLFAEGLRKACGAAEAATK